MVIHVTAVRIDAEAPRVQVMTSGGTVYYESYNFLERIKHMAIEQGFSIHTNQLAGGCQYIKFKPLPTKPHLKGYRGPCMAKYIREERV